ncbi:MAG: FkbM family methyltransferase [Actinomycetota bacterium]|nr:FkbM family methyltransferase [Actinomycetota bacterium]
MAAARAHLATRLKKCSQPQSSNARRIPLPPDNCHRIDFEPSGLGHAGEVSGFHVPLRSSSFGQAIKQPLRSLLARFGLEISTLQSGPAQFFAALLQQLRPDLLVDVGANQGQYAMRMRALGYAGRMVSFEPGVKAYRLLERNAARDPLWTVRQVALGAEEGMASLLVSRNLVSSSTLAVGAIHLAADRDSAADHTEEVACAPLDHLLAADPAGRLWLKIDVQGSEDQVLAGATAMLSRVQAVQCELSVEQLYAGQAGYLAVLATLQNSGFHLVEIIPGFRDPANGRLLQFDGIFIR